MITFVNNGILLNDDKIHNKYPAIFHSRDAEVCSFVGIDSYT